MEKSKIIFRNGVTLSDLERIREITASSGFFYDYEIPVAVELAEESWQQGPESDYHFLFADVDGITVAYSCYGPIAMTQGGFDLFWIVTHNDLRGSGIGKLLLEETHKAVKNMGGRFLIAETSAMEKYAPTRRFYESNNYDKEAVIADFYKIGDGKVIYIKRF
ncbi:MAG: GNAT family N-acetyltransferase [Bacteroidetes bacterium]|nr:GNAT family N-acetyltransferase [Bacteroidota bacterium]